MEVTFGRISLTLFEFWQGKTLDVITLFHKPSISASVRAANILKQASAAASATATEDQASDHTAQNKHADRDPFELEITENPPTADQLKSIFDYVGSGKAAQLVEGAASQSDALRKLKENGDAFKRPVVVDWVNARAVVGDQESEILKLVRSSANK
ncbi:hypothetical protein B0A52_06536 [Exophiala mesophila]|uniref:Uncharacterized protein n=1 Tax=Exophiala mesophila TaxID=212818 RepID=A0A438N1A2_EXOME|nr:hypothetical protein B0A52_06536 [Exophiala mesophila]